MSEAARTLRIERGGQMVPVPVAPGRLMDAREIAAEFFHGKRSAKWVLAHVPHKMKLGHVTVLWRERDVLAWLAAQGVAA